MKSKMSRNFTLSRRLETFLAKNTRMFEKVKKKNVFRAVPKRERLAPFLGSDLTSIISYEKTPPKFLG